MNSITTLVHARMKELGLKRGDLPSRLGFRNVAKGLRRLDAFLRTATGSKEILEQLHRALDVPEHVVLEAVRKTRETILIQEEAKARQAFRPHIFAVTEETIPSQICLCGLTGLHRFRTVNLPDDIFSQSPEKQKLLIRELIRENMNRYEGKAPFFGKILRYVLFRDFDEPVEARVVFNTEGEVLENAPECLKEAPGHGARVSVRVGHQDITRIFSSE